MPQPVVVVEAHPADYQRGAWAKVDGVVVAQHLCGVECADDGHALDVARSLGDAVVAFRSLPAESRERFYARVRTGEVSITLAGWVEHEGPTGLVS